MAGTKSFCAPFNFDTGGLSEDSVPRAFGKHCRSLCVQVEDVLHFFLYLAVLVSCGCNGCVIAAVLLVHCGNGVHA